MKNSSLEFDFTELRNDIHGQELAIESTQHPDSDGVAYCDFCESALPTDTPLQMDAIRNYDMHNLDRMLGPLEGWWIDSMRCPDCVVDRVYPPTDGWEEALVSCSTIERTGVISVEATDLRVIDYSAGPDGYYPPGFPLDSVDALGVSFCRWSFLRGYLPLVEANIPDIGERQFIYQYCRNRLDEIERDTTA
jgi:hypothetical protein